MTICTRTFIWLTWLMCASMAMPLLAQTAAPSTEQMIEQLKAPRTRSLRNLTVEAVPASSATVDAAHASEGASPTTGTPVSTVAQSAVNRPSLSLLIQFDFGSARVRPESQQALANLSQALQSTELVSSRFAVEGHTDAKGGADYNLKLSESRAQAVRDFLKSKGIDPNRLVAAGKGATELTNSNQPFAPENRRVRIVNLD